MNVIFLTIVRIQDIEERGIYTDLMRQFRNEGHQVYIVCPVERGSESWQNAHSSRLEKKQGIYIECQYS